MRPVVPARHRQGRLLAERKYVAEVREELAGTPTQLFIAGHSHILKIMYDDKYQCLHMNPGAAGTHGWHKVRTLIRFDIHGTLMKNCEVIELGTRGG